MRLIDADALIHAIRHRAADIIFRGEQTMMTGKDSCNPAEWTRGYEQGVMDTVNIMGLQKLIETEPVRHGRWVNERMLVGGFAEKWGCDCSECGKTIGEPLWKPPYCPNCGAKMDGDSDLSEIKALADLPCDSDLEHMTRFAMQRAINKK